ncbi:MAG: sigma-70 family RNA polymerase sigma factor [Chloroflexi bacterium]|nr:sigma-70 family RNA polymerase sigma factor [Chloroflexota bacterium]
MQSSTGDERALVAAARGGDVRSYEELVRRYQGLAFRVAYLVLGSADSAEDVTQDAFVKAFHALDRFDLERPFRPWLLRIVANEARNVRKATWRRTNLALRYGEIAIARSSGDTPEDIAAKSERRTKLLAALESLGEEERLVISLRYFLELSEQEMAEVLSCRRGTVKSRLSRSMDKLRQVVAERYPELEAAHDV